MRLLLISSSKAAGYEYLAYPKPYIMDFLGGQRIKIAFVPFAGVKQSYENLTGYEAYEKKVQVALDAMGYDVVSVHHHDDPGKTFRQTDAILVGGGSTWNLLKEVQERGMVDIIRDRVLNDNIPYLGWSAGANLACPTIRTTNDMPIIEPPSFDALNFIPFQINPHYLDANPEGHFGESRETRINEFIELNRDIYVAGLREGMMFRIEDDQIHHIGVFDKTCRVFHYAQEPFELGAGDDFSFLLKN